MKIVVLAGGISTERQVSISTGTMVCQALREKGHLAILVDVFFGIDTLEGEPFLAEYDVEAARRRIEARDADIEQVRRERKVFFGDHVLELCDMADMVFMALHGEDGENGKIQAAFDLLGISYTGTGYLGSALAMDKNITKQIFAVSEVPAPSGIIVNKQQGLADAFERGVSQVGFPNVVKPSCGGSSIGVYIANNEEEYRQALTDAFALEEELVVEQYIKGREFSVGVVAGEAYPIIEISPKEGFYNYENKYQAGKTIEICPAPISEALTREMQNWAVKACEVLRLEAYARVDFLVDDQERIYCLEANTLPGMTPTSLLPQEAAAMGLSYGDLCERLMEVSAE